MKLSLGIFEGMELEEILDLAKEVGFDAVFSDESAAEDPELMGAWRRGCDQRGLYLETSHCTLLTHNNPCRRFWKVGKAGDESLEVMLRNIDNAGDHNVPTLVLHVSADPEDPGCFEAGRERIAEMVKRAAEKHVQLAFENINHEGFFRQTMAAFPEEHVGFCYDNGHNICYLPGADFSAYYPRLKCIHIHDNGGVHDDHLFPGEGVYDFPANFAKMRAGGYDKFMTIEVAYNKMYQERYTKREFVQHAYDCAVRMRELYLSFPVQR